MAYHMIYSIYTKPNMAKHIVTYTWPHCPSPQKTAASILCLFTGKLPFPKTVKSPSWMFGQIRGVDRVIEDIPPL